ncbi:molybdopterin-dependent oxidoreductase [Galbitalea sp. SE-J8]|uniref:molybdopterin-dependent oxidoreductase n=1 Tax=Galbitalea sp. SE-J8 TaxID=3054952 RepID=UPI00259D116E|nr:molybdopterin-dependent oxidoreductase [Galbitalea sp. SE-J8]MDM4762824.1 molybdopterin-dependent oxidoreductase [Galbitalea sp. SE-J8]
MTELGPPPSTAPTDTAPTAAGPAAAGPAGGEPHLAAPARGAFAAASGLAAAIVGAATAEVVSLVVGGAGEPFAAVGSLAIDLAPPWLKTAVIGAFGTGDKAFLAVVLVVLVVVLAAVAGVLQARRPPFGVAVVVALGALAEAAVLTRADAALLSFLPVAAGALLAAALLRTLAARLTAWAAPLSRSEGLSRSERLSRSEGLARSERLAPRPRSFERRRFLQLLVASAGVGAVVGVVGRAAASVTQVARGARAALTLPAPATTAPPVPAGADLATGDLAAEGLSPWVTPNADFYRIDTALSVPQLAPEDWSLTITGLVDTEVTLGWQDLVALPLVERYTTLACVSNEVGGDLIGNALWLGYPIRELLARAAPHADADMVLSRSVDGFTAGTPLAVLQDEGTDALLAIGMNGEPLPIEHGFPARLVVPGLYGYVSATKWVTELRVTRFADDEGYWTPRGWSARGPVKTGSRIDVPRAGRRVAAGTVAVAGVAWAQHTGIAKVEVQVDDGEWREATLASVVTVDSWLQWSIAWRATPGAHTIRVRATDATGATQPESPAPPAPDGATGWHGIDVTVS